MKVLLDTSVLIAAIVESHPKNQWSSSWLDRVRRQEITAVVSAHTLAEVYAVLTGMPLRPRISPILARQLIQENILKQMEVVALTTMDYRNLLDHITQLNLCGGVIYDAVIAHVATLATVDHLVTLNGRDFYRAYPALSATILHP